MQGEKGSDGASGPVGIEGDLVRTCVRVCCIRVAITCDARQGQIQPFLIEGGLLWLVASAIDACQNVQLLNNAEHQRGVGVGCVCDPPLDLPLQALYTF